MTISIKTFDQRVRPPLPRICHMLWVLVISFCVFTTKNIFLTRLTHASSPHKNVDCFKILVKKYEYWGLIYPKQWRIVWVGLSKKNFKHFLLPQHPASLLCSWGVFETICIMYQSYEKQCHRLTLAYQLHIRPRIGWRDFENLRYTHAYIYLWICTYISLDQGFVCACFFFNFM